MLILRKQVDRIDLELLKLLQQRTRLARRIGETKRRHGAVIYVPERERELLDRVERLTRGKFPARSVTAIYREILSSSRAAQGQGGIGLLAASRSAILLPARWCFGACGELVTHRCWQSLSTALASGSLALGLVTGTDLAKILSSRASRLDFEKRFAAIHDFSCRIEEGCSLPDRIFVIVPRGATQDATVNRLLILIECKAKANTVKSWLKSMAEDSLHVEEQQVDASAGMLRLVRLSSARGMKIDSIVTSLRSVGVNFSTLGVYGGSEDYAG